MKKLVITMTIVLGVSLTTYAQGGLFHRGASAADGERSSYALTKDANAGAGEATPMLPIHELEDPGNQPAPLGSGIAVLLGLGGAYLLGKKRK